MRYYVLGGLVLSALTSCKPRTENSSGLRDVQLTSLSDRKNYVVYLDENETVNVRECPPDAIPGQVSEGVVAPAKCLSGDADILNRAQCSLPTGSAPISMDTYKKELLDAMGLQNMEGTMKDLAAQGKELTRMENDLKKLDQVLARNPTPPLSEEAEKARVTIGALRESVAALDAEVNHNRYQYDVYSNIIRSLSCEVSTQIFKGEAEYSQILAPFENETTDVEFIKQLNSRLPENRPFALSTTFETRETGRVAAVSIQIDLQHDYPSEVGIRITSPDGKVAQVESLYQTVAKKQLQLGVINTTYSAELMKLTGANISGTWRVEYGDRDTDTGTISSIRIVLHRMSPQLVEVTSAYRKSFPEWEIPSESTRVIPIVVGRSQKINDFAFSFTSASVVEASFTSPTGQVFSFVRNQSQYSLQPSDVQKLKNGDSFGVWMLQLINKGSTARVVNTQLAINNQTPQVPVRTTTNAGTSNTSQSTSANASSSSNSAVTMADVTAAIAQSKAQYTTYNNDTSAVSACKGAGANAGWSTTMQDYYCVFPISSPEIRTCFTGSVRGDGGFQKRSYAEAYTYCARSHNGKPMKWIEDNQDAVFKAVMIDKKF